jgi:uncharacterized protein (DUF58 family)
VRSGEAALLKRIRIKTRRRLNTLFVGEYHSAFKGRGLLFDSVREYQYGDDARDIDWNVSARMNHLFVKKYAEERELSVALMIDLSASMDFGSVRGKRELTMEAVTLLLYLAQMNNDRVTALLFTDDVEKYIAPKKGKRFILQVLDEIMSFTPKRRGTDISRAVDFLRRVLKKRSVIFVISDFLDEDYILRLRLLRRRHDVIPVMISDPLERGFRRFALTEFVDLETGRTVLADIGPGGTADRNMENMDVIRLSTGEPIEAPILRFFEKRNRTRHAGVR